MGDPIIAAIIAATSAIFIAWITHKSKAQASSSAQSAPTSEPAVALQAAPQPVYSPPPRPPFPAGIISHLEMANAIDRVPPFQRDGVRASFVGMRVSWPAKFSSFSRRRSGEVSISVDLIEDRCYVFCSALPEDCKGLEFAHEGTLVVVEGEIETVDRYETTLIKCKVSAIPASEAVAVENLRLL